ncbi:hypothetical protein ABZ682_22905 [Streptomyces griseoviridis]|uniref:hypothetical protein n=1 Tax=Streptomyces griseoviridis TaxID=45398 RepID=UPI003409CF89
MGAILQPLPDMEPWYAVEARRESAYLTAAVYVGATIQQRVGEGVVTDDQRAAAWKPVDEHTIIAPGTPSALASALRQIAEHPAYREWRATGRHAGGAGAELRDGQAVVTAPNSCQYEEVAGAAEVGHVEFDYRDVGPILADLQRLGA